MPTRRARLRGIGRIDAHHCSASLFRFTEQVPEKCGPRCISDTFGELRVFHHIPHDQRLHRQQPEALDQFADLLFDEVFAAVPNPLMDPRYHLALLLARCSLFASLGQLARSNFQLSLILTEKAWIGDFLVCREIGKGL